MVNNRLFVVGGFSGKHFLDTIEYLAADKEEWCCFLPSKSKSHSSGSESSDTENGKMKKDSGKESRESSSDIQVKNGQCKDSENGRVNGNRLSFNEETEKDDCIKVSREITGKASGRLTCNNNEGEIIMMDNKTVGNGLESRLNCAVFSIGDDEEDVHTSAAES